MRVIIICYLALTLKVNSDAASHTSLERALARANGHVDINVRSRAVKHRLLDPQLDQRGINIVRLARTIIARRAIRSAALVVGAAHGQPLSVAGARGGGVALGAVDEGDVVPDLSVGDGVLELGVLAVLDAVGGGDLERGARVVENLGVLGAGGHEGAGGLVGAADR